jgi:hypothetical protein
MDVSLEAEGLSTNKFSDWLWQINAPLSAAISIRLRCLISQTVYTILLDLQVFRLFLDGPISSNDPVLHIIIPQTKLTKSFSKCLFTMMNSPLNTRLE